MTTYEGNRYRKRINFEKNNKIGEKNSNESWAGKVLTNLLKLNHFEVGEKCEIVITLQTQNDEEKRRKFVWEPK